MAYAIVTTKFKGTKLNKTNGTEVFVMLLHPSRVQESRCQMFLYVGLVLSERNMPLSEAEHQYTRTSSGERKQTIFSPSSRNSTGSGKLNVWYCSAILSFNSVFE